MSIVHHRGDVSGKRPVEISYFLPVFVINGNGIFIFRIVFLVKKLKHHTFAIIAFHSFENFLSVCPIIVSVCNADKFCFDDIHSFLKK